MASFTKRANYTHDIDAIVDLMNERDMAGPEDTLETVMAILDQAEFAAHQQDRIRGYIIDHAPEWWPGADELEEAR